MSCSKETDWFGSHRREDLPLSRGIRLAPGNEGHQSTVSLDVTGVERHVSHSIQKIGDILDRRHLAPLYRLLIPLFICFFYIPGGCLGFLPSTVSRDHHHPVLRWVNPFWPRWDHRCPAYFKTNSLIDWGPQLKALVTGNLAAMEVL